MEDRYYSYSRYLKKRFGCRVHRLSLDAGFGCPNLDGTLSRDGCIFCDNRAFSHYARKPAVSLEEQIKQSISYCRSRFKAGKFIAYFQSFSNTYGSLDFLRRKYEVVKKFSDIVGLCVSTRPDCIDEEKLYLLNGYGDDYEVYIEYGLQSVHDRTLQAINRNHSFADFKKAIIATSRFPRIHSAAHVILGLPGETEQDMISTARKLAGLPLWGIKFHCLHAVKETVLAEMYARGEADFLSEDKYIDILIRFLELTPEDRVVLRLVSDADPQRLLAPLWVNEKQRVIQRIERELETRGTWQGRCAGGGKP